MCASSNGTAHGISSQVLVYVHTYIHIHIYIYIYIFIYNSKAVIQVMFIRHGCVLFKHILKHITCVTILYSFVHSTGNYLWHKHAVCHTRFRPNAHSAGQTWSIKHKFKMCHKPSLICTQCWSLLVTNMRHSTYNIFVLYWLFAYFLSLHLFSIMTALCFEFDSHHIYIYIHILGSLLLLAHVYMKGMKAQAFVSSHIQTMHSTMTLW